MSFPREKPLPPRESAFEPDVALGSPAPRPPRFAVGLRCCASTVGLCACRWYTASPAPVPVPLGSRVRLLKLAGTNTLAKLSFALRVVSCLQRSVKISTRLTGRARNAGTRVRKPEFSPAELHKRPSPASAPHKRGSRLHFPIVLGDRPVPQRHNGVAAQPVLQRESLEPSSSVPLSFSADKGVKPRERSSHRSQERGKVSGSGGPGKVEHFITCFSSEVILRKTTLLCPKSDWEWQHIHAELCKKPAAPCPGKYHCQQVNQGQRQQPFCLGLHRVMAAGSAV